MTATRFRTPLAALVHAVLVAACASSSASRTPPCSGFEPPRLLAAHPVVLPQTYVVARIGDEVLSEAVIDPQGAVVDTRVVHSQYEVLAPYAELSLRESRFTVATIEGNPVAARCLVTTAVGVAGSTPPATPYDLLWAHVPGTEPREARWQLRDSVRKIALAVHVGSSGREAVVVARAPSGSEKTLLRKAVPAPADFRETVRTGDFLEGAGDYRLELRVDGKTTAWTTFTVANDAKDAIVNACEPLTQKK
jgi:hypothetical protein